MKKLLGALGIVIVVALILLAQNTFTSFVYQEVGTVAGTGGSISTAWFSVQNSGGNYHQLTWTVTGAPASCTIQVDYSNNGSTVAGQTIASQTCTTNGSFLNTVAVTPAFVRITYNISVGGTLFYNTVGYMILPASSGGTITSGSITTNGTGAGAIGLLQGIITQPPANSFNIISNTTEPNAGVNMVLPSTTGQGALEASLGSGAAGTVTCAGCGTLTGGGNINISAPGAGYVNIPACWITGGGGSGGTCSVTALSAGTIIASNVVINNGGSGYTSNATLNFSVDLDMGWAGNTYTLFGSTSGTQSISCLPLATCTGLQATANLSVNKFTTNANCAASGTAANPSVVTCTSQGAGAFSCSISASTGTCVVNDTAVGANSIIVINPDASLGARLSVTCNTTADIPTGPRISARTAGTSFTINLGTLAVNPGCYTFVIIN